jgi:hypothetical protein
VNENEIKGTGMFFIIDSRKRDRDILNILTLHCINSLQSMDARRDADDDCERLVLKALSSCLTERAREFLD